jgi:histidine ammonia-lyase
MGPIAARKAARVVEHVEQILAIELLTAAQALDFRSPLVPADGPRIAVATLRARVPALDQDRVLAPDFELARELIASGALLSAVETELGSLS